MLVGIICAVLASIAFGIGPVFTKELLAGGMDVFGIMLYPRISTLIATGIVIIIRKTSLKVTKTQMWQLVLFCGVFNGLTALLLVSSYNYLPLGIATMFHFIYPVIVMVGMIAFYKERVSVKKIIAAVLAVSGLSLILDLSGKMSLLGVALALGSGVAYAVYVIANRESSYQKLPVIVLIFYSSLINLILFAIVNIASGGLIIPTTLWEWLMITANGLISGLFAFLMMIIAIRRIGASNAAITNMLEPITALIAGVIIFNEKLNLSAILGCILVILAITLMTLNKKRNNIKEAK